MMSRSLILSLVDSPNVSIGASASRALDGWQCAVSLLGFTLALHYRRFVVAP